MNIAENITQLKIIIEGIPLDISILCLKLSNIKKLTLKRKNAVEKKNNVIDKRKLILDANPE